MKTCLGTFVVLLALASTANAAPILNGNILIGATGVNVGGTLYNVEFVDGTCVALFTGCNEASDFTFPTQGAAEVASQALLAQVFLNGPSGNFDSNPLLTFGCGSTDVCEAITPFAPPGGFALASNWTLNNLDEVNSFDGLNPNGDTTLATALVFARWTPAAAVPEPASLMLLGLGLAGMGARRWRQRKP